MINDLEFEAPDHIPGWDYNTDLTVRRSVRVDTDRVRSSAGLPPGTPISLAVVWESSGSRQQMRCAHELLPASGPLSLELTGFLRGADLGGVITLSTFVLLAEEISVSSPFTAHLSGSELWRDGFDIRLEDERDLFPIAIVDFAIAGFPEQAGWYLEISGGPDAPAAGALLLCVNKANKAAAQAFTNLLNPTPVDLAITSSAYSDVTRTLIEYALILDDFDDSTEFSDDSLGAVMQGIFRRFFEGRTVEDVRRMHMSDPTGFASEVQAVTALYQELN
ncbi:hypothetical protein ACWDTI_05060 [Gordonia sp. NPDC003424]